MDTTTKTGQEKRLAQIMNKKIDSLWRKYRQTWNKKYVHFAWKMGYPVDYSDKDHAGGPKY